MEKDAIVKKKITDLYNILALKLGIIQEKIHSIIEVFSYTKSVSNEPHETSGSYEGQ